MFPPGYFVLLAIGALVGAVIAAVAGSWGAVIVMAGLAVIAAATAALKRSG